MYVCYLYHTAYQVLNKGTVASISLLYSTNGITEVHVASISLLPVVFGTWLYM